MRIDSPYQNHNVPWRKGQLHAHSNAGISQCGKRDPDQVAAFYRERGYDFLGLSDHNWLTPTEAYGTPDFVCIPSEEHGTAWYHVLCLGITKTILGEDLIFPEQVDAVRAQRGLPILAHPAWSNVPCAEIVAVGIRLCGIEVYNHTASFTYGKGHSVNIWDELLMRRLRLWGFATDDSHFSPDAPYGDRGWIQVRSATLDPRDLMGAIGRGDFYSSNGPTIKDVSVDENGLMTVEAGEPCDSVVFVAKEHRGWRYHMPVGGDLCIASHQLTPDMLYCRAEVRSGNKTAWTNPVFIEGVTT